MDNSEAEKAKLLFIAGIIDYEPDTIVRKTTGTIHVAAFDKGQEYHEKITMFGTFVQVIDGKALIIKNGISNIIETGHSIILPAHSNVTFIAKERFKMISTFINSGNE